LASLSAVLKEARQNEAKNEGRPLAVNGGKAPFDPATNGIFVDFQKARNLLDSVVTVDLDQPIVQIFTH
jgi:hypothetical protein